MTNLEALMADCEALARWIANTDESRLCEICALRREECAEFDEECESAVMRWLLSDEP